jgi:hypothetical protein
MADEDTINSGKLSTMKNNEKYEAVKIIIKVKICKSYIHNFSAILLLQ